MAASRDRSAQVAAIPVSLPPLRKSLQAQRFLANYPQVQLLPSHDEVIVLSRDDPEDQPADCNIVKPLDSTAVAQIPTENQGRQEDARRAGPHQAAHGLQQQQREQSSSKQAKRSQKLLAVLNMDPHRQPRPTRQFVADKDAHIMAFPQPVHAGLSPSTAVLVGGTAAVHVPIRRSFLTAEAWRRIMLHQEAHYPPSALKNPYLPAKSNGSERQADDLTPLHVAAGTGSLGSLERCLGVFDVNEVDKEGRTPLIYAVIGNHPSIIELLHRHQAMLSVADHDGRTACHWAAFYGRDEILALLIRMGANWKGRDNEGRTPLHWSTGNDSTKCLALLLAHATQFDMNEPDGEQMTPLHWAVYHNHPEHVQLLLGKHANVMMTDVEGKTPLHWSAHLKDAVCANWLVEVDPRIVEIADLDGRTVLHLACGENNFALAALLVSMMGGNKNAYDVTFRTPLHWAAVSGHHHLVNLLLESGASDAVKDNVGATPLHYACSKNHSQCVAALMSRADVSYLSDNEGRHPLMWAVTKGHVQSVRILLEKGVDCRLSDNYGNTALHSAAHVGQTHCVALLIERHAEVDAVDHQTHTPLFRAVERGYAETASMLIQAGADTTRVDQEGRTPLHWASLFGHLPVLSLLLANGVLVGKRDNYGKTAMHCGAYNGHNEIVKYLIESGADFNEFRVDRDGFTALHWASVQNHPHTVELLLLEGANPNPTSERFELPTPMDYAYMMLHSNCVFVFTQYGGKTLSMIRYEAALSIQKRWRGHSCRKKMRDTIRSQLLANRLRRNIAAKKIQVVFRKFANRNLREPSSRRRSARPLHVPIAKQPLVDAEHTLTPVKVVFTPPTLRGEFDAGESMDSDELAFYQEIGLQRERERKSDEYRQEAAMKGCPPTRVSMFHRNQFVSRGDSNHSKIPSLPSVPSPFSTPAVVDIVSKSVSPSPVTLDMYKEQLKLIEKHQLELEELKKETEMKIKQLADAMSGLNQMIPLVEPEQVGLEFLPFLISSFDRTKSMANPFTLPSVKLDLKTDATTDRQNSDPVTLPVPKFNSNLAQLPDVIDVYDMSLTDEELEYFQSLKNDKHSRRR